MPRARARRGRVGALAQRLAKAPPTNSAHPLFSRISTATAPAQPDFLGPFTGIPMNMSSAAPKTRWLALWLPRLATDRLRRANAAPSDGRPVALYAKSGNAFALTAVDPRASEAGLSEGMALADARAMQPDLAAYVDDLSANSALLDAIADWCERFTPIVVLDPPAGLFLDISGCAHLFDGETALLKEVKTLLHAQGFAACVAIAPNPAAAWAFARFADVPIVDENALLDALAPLPIAALRLTTAAAALLRRLGLTTIGQIAHAPRAPFAARAGQHAMQRLDQALGRTREALMPRRPPPPVFAVRRLVEPIVTLDAVLIVVEALCADLATKLDRNGAGARLLRLSLFGLDGKMRGIELGLSKPERDPKPMARLLRERLNVTPENFDAEFGFEAMRLDAVAIAPILWHPTDLASASVCDPAAEARLIDTLAARLGADRIGRLGVRETHAPERATIWADTSQANGTIAIAPDDGVMRRPLTLLARAQPIETIASVPDGHPVRFRWRRVLREIARAEGPERISPNWLRAQDARTRDYYRVEDRQGRRYWLYREGFYDKGEPPRWFLHGLFA